MATRKVVVRECDRCGKREEFPEGKLPTPSTGPAFGIVVNGITTVKFDDICDKCQKRINALTNAIVGKEEEPKEVATKA
jgi:hypothetical protein